MKFKSISFPKDDISFISPTWDEINSLTFDLAEQIIAKGVEFDRIITLAKGGWPMTRSLVDFLQIDEVASVGIKFYQGINRRMNRPEVYQDLPIAVRGEKVILFDDVADTGESLEFTRDFLKEEGVAEVSCATLFYKPHSTLIPNFYAAETKAWIIFPYEQLESMELLQSKWEKQGLNQSEIDMRFKQLQLNDGYINHYKKLHNL